jgi:hypothetical protein
MAVAVAVTVVAATNGVASAAPAKKTAKGIVSAADVTKIMGTEYEAVYVSFDGLERSASQAATQCSVSALPSLNCGFAPPKSDENANDHKVQTFCVNDPDSTKPIKVGSKMFALDSDTAPSEAVFRGTASGVGAGKAYVFADGAGVYVGWTAKGKGLPKKGAGCITKVDGSATKANQNQAVAVAKLTAGRFGGKHVTVKTVAPAKPLLTEGDVNIATGLALVTKPSEDETCTAETMSCSFSTNPDPNSGSSEDTTYHVECGADSWDPTSYQNAAPVDVGKVGIGNVEFETSTNVVFMPFQTAPSGSRAQPIVCVATYSVGSGASSVATNAAISKIFASNLAASALLRTVGVK